MHSRAAALGILTALALQITVTALGEQAQPPQAGTTIAIRGATVLTITRGVIPNGTILIRDGKIAAVGADVAVPAGAQIVDAAGKFVSPGLIDAHVHISADSINEGATTVSSMTGIEDVFNPTDVDMYRDLAGGVTTVNILHGSANPIGGKNYVVKMRWGKSRPEDFIFEGAMPGIKFALGENPKDLRQGFRDGPLRYPVTRMGTEYVIRDAFTRAKAYRASWQTYERRKAAGEAVLAPRRDLQLEPLVEVLEGKRLVHAHCYRADEILMLIRLAEEMGFKITTFQHVLEGYKVAKEIAAHGAGGSTFIDSWGGKPEMNEGIPYNPAVMTRKGVVVSLNSDSAERSRRLNTDAAKAVKWGGVTQDEAMAMITINPAKHLKIENRVGSIETGKDADLVIWTQHPLSVYAIVDRVYIDGTTYYDRQTDTQRITTDARSKQTLMAAERRDAAPSTTARPEPDPRNTSSVSSNGTNGNGGGSGSAGQTQPAAALPMPANLPRGVVAITNARIYPVSRPMIARGTVVIRDGLIQAVGADVTAPAGAKIIDAAGAEVYPGWINARSTLGLADPGPSGYADTNEMLEFNPQLHTVVAFHNDSDSIPVTRANGVTTTAVTPGGGLLGGQVAIMNLDGVTWEESAVRRSAGIAFQFPELGSNRPYAELKKTRDEKLARLSTLLSQARAYAKGGPNKEIDWVLDAMLPIIDRSLPLITRADREADIRAAIEFADREHLRLIISGGQEAPMVAPLLRERNIPVIVGPVLALPLRDDASHAAVFTVAGDLVKAGVKIAFATGDPSNARLLPYHAAMAVAWGLPREEAIKALTINAAEILGVGERIGSIEPGRIANLIVAKGDPLEIQTEITHVIIAGRDVDLMNKHRALYDRYIARP